MKALLAFAFIFSTSIAFAGQLEVDVIPTSGHGGATYLQFTEDSGRISSIGNGPFSGRTNTTDIEEKADGSFQGFVFGRPFNLVCSDTACVNNGSTQVQIKVTKTGAATHYEGMIEYHFVNATVTNSSIAVNTDGTFSATLGKNNTFAGQGAFSRVRFGSFNVRLTPSGGFNLNDPRLFVLTVLNTFTGR